MKKTKENKGITLIALIITIIVMLILVGVSVNVALNGGLFDTAKMAAEKTNQAVQGEKELSIYVELIAEADELVERYPFEGVFEAGGGIQLHNANISYLYKYILEKYGVTAENFDLPTAIRTANTFYEIYDREIQRVTSDSNRENFWNKLANPMDNSGVFFADFTPTTEEIDTRVALQLGFMFSKNSPVYDSINGIEVLSTKINNTKHYVISNANIVFDSNSTNSDVALINRTYDTFFPGGHFPRNEITGTAVSEFYYLMRGVNGQGQICEMTEEIANSNILFYSVRTEVEPNDYIGKTICIVTKEESPGGSMAGYDSMGIPLNNVFVINTETGVITYIDDDGQPSKPLS